MHVSIYNTYVSLSLPFILGNALKIVESASWGRQMCHLNLTQSPTSLIDGACFLAPSVKSRQLTNFCYFYYILANVYACIYLYPVLFKQWNLNGMYLLKYMNSKNSNKFEVLDVYTG